MNDRTIRRVYAGFLAICVVISFAALAAFRNLRQAAATADWVNHTHATIYALDRVVGSLVAGDGAVRTFVWTNNPRELTQARGEFSEMTDHLESAKALTHGEPAVHAQVLQIEQLAEQHAKAALALAAARRESDQAGLATLLQNDPGIETLQEIKRHAAHVRAEQFELLDQRDHAAYLQAQTTRWVVGSCVVLDLLLLAALAWLVRDDITTRKRLAQTLQDANETLEAKVTERTRDLAAANARLAAENLERKWAAQSLEHQLRYSQTIVNAASDLVFVVTRALTITRVNPAAVQRLGQDEEAILGRPLAELVQHDDAAVLGQAMTSGRELHAQPVRITGKRGDTLAASLTLLPLRDNDKVVGGVVLLQLISS